MGLSMEKLAEQIENMTLGEFNKMMYRFIDRAKRMGNIKQIFDSMNKSLNKFNGDDSQNWKRFFRNHPERGNYNFGDDPISGHKHTFDEFNKFTGDDNKKSDWTFSTDWFKKRDW